MPPLTTVYVNAITLHCCALAHARHFTHSDGLREILSSPLRATQHSLFSPENREVTYKLLRYSFYMVTMPVAAFYLSKNTLFQGRATFAPAYSLASLALF